MSDPNTGLSTDGSSGLSSSSLLGLGGLALGGAGLGAILAAGPAPLPSEFGTVTGTEVPWLQSAGQYAENLGQEYAGAGAQALQMAQAGQLTPEQQAQLSKYASGEQNQAIQTYANMGRNFNQDTSAISTQGEIDTNVNAMAQQQIQTTIALGLGEVSAGSTFMGQGATDIGAATNALITAGNAQIQLDTNYSNALTSVFTAIGSIAGAAAKVAIPSDAALKTDIHPIGILPNGVELVSFRFRWHWQPFVGVVAQQVQKIFPEAVLVGDHGYLCVDYKKIGAPFVTLQTWLQWCATARLAGPSNGEES